MSSKNERKKSLGRGLSSFLDVGGFDDIVESKKDEDKGKSSFNNSRGGSFTGSSVKMKVPHAIPIALLASRSRNVITASSGLM